MGADIVVECDDLLVLDGAYVFANITEGKFWHYHCHVGIHPGLQDNSLEELDAQALTKYGKRVCA